MNDAFISFAQVLMARLCRMSPEAEPLKARKARGGADIGIDEDGEFEPLLRVANGSSAANVMSLWVRVHNEWQRTFIRGTPDQIAQQLAGPFEYLWRIPVLAMRFDASPSRPRPASPKARRKPASR